MRPSTTSDTSSSACRPSHAGVVKAFHTRTTLPAPAARRRAGDLARPGRRAAARRRVPPPSTGRRSACCLAPDRTRPGPPPCGWSGTARAPATSPVTPPRRTGTSGSTCRTATSTCRCPSSASGRQRPSAAGLADQPEDEQPTVRVDLAVRPRPADRRDRPGRSGSGPAGGRRRAAARARVRRPRRPHPPGHHGAVPRGVAPGGPRSASSTTGRRAASPGSTSRSGCARCSTTSAWTPDGERVLLMAHQVVVLLTRYVLEGMDEQHGPRPRRRGRGRQLRGHLLRLRRGRGPAGARALQRGRPRSRSRTTP